MDNFDFKKYLAENKLHEAMFDVATTEKIAQQVADAFTAEDNELDLKYAVTPGTGENSFDLDVEAGPNTPGEDWKDENGFGIDNYLGQYAGGSFYIKDGVVYNAASRNAPVAKVSPEGEVEMISAEDSRAAIGMKESVEEKKSNKMKKSELKEMIRQAMLAETEEKETVKEGTWALGSAKDIQRIVDMLNKLKDNAYNVIGDDVFFDGLDNAISRAEELMMNAPLSEAAKDEEVDVEADAEEIDVDADTETADAGEVDVEANAEVGLSGDKKKVQDNLEAALEAAKALGDEKLSNQIGNSITFFTRTHVVGKDQVAEDLSIHRMLRIAGIKK